MSVSGAAEAFSDAGDGDFDWQYLQGALVLLGAAGRCQRCFAGVEKVWFGTVTFGSQFGHRYTKCGFKRWGTETVW